MITYTLLQNIANVQKKIIAVNCHAKIYFTTMHDRTSVSGTIYPVAREGWILNCRQFKLHDFAYIIKLCIIMKKAYCHYVGNIVDIIIIIVVVSRC